LIRQVTQNSEIDIVLGKTLGVLGHAELIEPIRNLLHCDALSDAPCDAPVETLSEPKVLGHFG
jgi:hypothetical protein